MKNKTSRRRFLAATAASAAGVPAASLLSSAATPGESPGRKFYAILSCGRLGFKCTFQETVTLAQKYGFEGVDPDPGLFGSLPDGELRKLLDDLKAKSLRLGAGGLPVDFRKDEATFNDGLKKLPSVAAALERAGVWRVSTWVLPSSDEVTYLQNFRQHACRLRACAKILADHGQKLGLEYVAPRTFWRSQRHPFVHTMSEMKELLVAVGTDNLGFQLDSWHWFNAEETEKEILTLRGDEVMSVDLNDAPAGLTLDQYVDDRRELPAATGVIPVQQFLQGLVKIGYDGPLQAEPFNASLRAMPLEQACAAASSAIKKAFSLAGV